MKSLFGLFLLAAISLAQFIPDWKDPAIQAALRAAREGESQVIEEQAAVCEVPAPPFQESKRGEELRTRFVQLGLKDVRVDRAGNVIGVRPGLNPTPNLVFSAHLDSVFPAGTNVQVTREGAVLKGPGIGDNCRGLAVMLGVIRALDAAKVRTPGTVTFVATVGEEGLGNLRGVRNLISDSLNGKIDRFVAVDGTGWGIISRAVGSLRYRVTFRGPGGHSYGSFGAANPIHAMGRAIARISEFRVGPGPKTTFNVGRVGGGTSVNSIAYEAWMEVDIRSVDPARLKALDDQLHKAIEEAADEENAHANGRGRISAAVELAGNRPAGETPEGSAIVRIALAASRALNLPAQLREGSTDANIPMTLGIPAIAIGGGGKGTGAHSLNETFDPADSNLGTERAVLLAIALAQ